MLRPEETWVRAMRSRDYERAWAIDVDFLATRDPAARDDPSLPYHLRQVWDGRPFDGRDVLVRCYHGLGDTIQFARYLPLLAERAASVTLECPPRLLGLIGGVAGIDRLVPFDPAAPLTPAECDIEIMELAFALRAPPAAAPPPYLAAAPALLPAGTIGLCHEAGPWDSKRSVPAELLGPLCQGRKCVTLVAGATGLPVLNPDGCPFDMEATAALVAGAALVISVDTMIAHLAGALGTPVWLLLRHDPDWRWPAEGRRSDWYPSMRLYHQPSPGEWAPVIDEVAADLAALAPNGLREAEE